MDRKVDEEVQDVTVYSAGGGSAPSTGGGSLQNTFV
jgi:hypothetical protein